MSGFQVGVAALSGPAQRLKQVGVDLATAGSGAATAAGSGGAAAGDPAVVNAAAVFEAGVRAVLGALGEEAGLLGDKVQRAGITYDTTDRTAMPTTPTTTPTAAFTGSTPPASEPPAAPSPAPPQTSVEVGSGDSLWGIAAQRLGPGASNEAVAAESARWYAANRDLIGPDPDLVRSGITLRAPQG